MIRGLACFVIALLVLLVLFLNVRAGNHYHYKNSYSAQCPIDTLPPMAPYFYTEQQLDSIRALRDYLPGSVMIATPGGDVPISELQYGDSIYSIGYERVKKVVAIRYIMHAKGNRDYERVEVALADGRSISLPATHPLGQFQQHAVVFEPGDTLDGSVVISKVIYTIHDTATYEIVPDLTMGKYWANGIEAGSTLHDKFYVEDLLRMGW